MIPRNLSLDLKDSIRVAFTQIENCVKNLTHQKEKILVVIIMIVLLANSLLKRNLVFCSEMILMLINLTLNLH
jgi:hypothetical protein